MKKQVRKWIAAALTAVCVTVSLPSVSGKESFSMEETDKSSEPQESEWQEEESKEETDVFPETEAVALLPGESEKEGADQEYPAKEPTMTEAQSGFQETSQQTEERPLQEKISGTPEDALPEQTKGEQTDHFASSQETVIPGDMTEQETDSPKEASEPYEETEKEGRQMPGIRMLEVTEDSDKDQRTKTILLTADGRSCEETTIRIYLWAFDGVLPAQKAEWGSCLDNPFFALEVNELEEGAKLAAEAVGTDGAVHPVSLSLIRETGASPGGIWIEFALPADSKTETKVSFSLDPQKTEDRALVLVASAQGPEDGETLIESAAIYWPSSEENPPANAPAEGLAEAGSEENGADRKEKADGTDREDPPEEDGTDRKDPPEEEEPPDEEDETAEWVIGDYPENQSLFCYSTRYVWVYDTFFDPSAYQIFPEDPNVIQSICSALPDLENGSRNPGDTFEVLYEFRLKDPSEYSWKGSVAFEFTAQRSDATARSEQCGDIMIGEISQADGWEGVIPSLARTTLCGPQYTALQNEKGFDLYRLDLGYDPALFNTTVLEDGGFDLSAPGEYEVTFQVSHYMLPNYPWYVKCRIQVISGQPERGVRIHVQTRNLNVSAKGADGEKKTASYGIDAIFEDGIVSLTASSRLGGTVSPEFSLFHGGEKYSEKDWISVTEQSDSSVCVSLFLPEEGGDLLCITDPSYDITNGGEEKSSGGWIVDADLEAAIADGFISTKEAGQLSQHSGSGSGESRMQRAAGKSSHTKSWSSGIGTLHLTSTCHNYNPYSLAYNGGYMTLSSSVKTSIRSWLEEYGVSLSTSLPSTISVACADGDHNRLGWLSGAKGSWTLQASLSVSAGGSGSLRLTLTGTNGASYQTFAGYVTRSTEPSVYYLKIKKRIVRGIALGYSENLQMNTNFSIYSDAACKDRVQIVTIEGAFDEGSSMSKTIYIEVDEPGAYYAKETGFCDGCVPDYTTVYGPAKAGSSKSQAGVFQSSETGYLNNWPYTFSGPLLTKTDGVTGKGLPGAVFRVQYAAKKGGPRIKTWYLQTDASGILRYDAAHLLPSWNGQSSDLIPDGYEYLPVGWLYITEAEAPATYLTDPKTYEAELTIQSTNNRELSIRFSDASQNGPFTHKNWPKTGSLKVKKELDETGKKAVKNRTFTFVLSGTSDAGEAVSLSKSIEGEGTVLFEEVPVGTYTIREEFDAVCWKASGLSSAEIRIDSGKTTEYTFRNEAAVGDGRIIKKITDPSHTIGDLSGFVFCLSGESDTGILIRLTAETDSDGIVTFPDIPVGTYTLEESGGPGAQNSLPKWWQSSGPWIISVKSGETASVTAENIYQTGNIEIHKTIERTDPSAYDEEVEINANQSLSGFAFHLTGVSDSGAPADLYAVTGSDGIARFFDVPVGTKDNYTVTEVSSGEVASAAASGNVSAERISLQAIQDLNQYMRPQPFVVSVTYDQTARLGNTTSVTCHNSLKKWRVTVRKKDALLLIDGAAQYQASLKGAVYGLYDGTLLVGTYTTDENGEFVTDYYVCGDHWYLQEIEPSPGYLLDETKYPVLASASGFPSDTEKNEPHLSAELQKEGDTDCVYEMPRKGGVTIQKTDGKGNRLSGVVYELRDSSGSLVATEISNDGKALFSDLLPGNYQITEIKTLAGQTLLADPIPVQIPLVLTEEEADRQANLDFTKAAHYEAEKSYYFYDLTYEVTNSAVLVMPKAGGSGFPAACRAGGMILTALGAFLVVRRRQEEGVRK